MANDQQDKDTAAGGIGGMGQGGAGYGDGGGQGAGQAPDAGAGHAGKSGGSAAEGVNDEQPGADTDRR